MVGFELWGEECENEDLEAGDGDLGGIPGRIADLAYIRPRSEFRGLGSSGTSAKRRVIWRSTELGDSED